MMSHQTLPRAPYSKQSQTKQQKRRMTSFELSHLIVTKGIRSRTELLAYAHEQKLTEKSDIAEFIVEQGPRMVLEVLATVWKMRNTQAKLTTSKKYLKRQLGENTQAVLMVNGSPV